MSATTIVDHLVDWFIHPCSNPVCQLNIISLITNINTTNNNIDKFMTVKSVLSPLTALFFDGFGYSSCDEFGQSKVRQK